jgi:hypothetical protein
MSRSLALALAAAAACGSPPPASPDAAADASTIDLLDRLKALPGVDAYELVPQLAPAGYRYFHLGVDLPADHDHPEGQHFTQQLGLVAKDPSAPLVLYDTGYFDYTGDDPFELTLLLHGNQLVMEHRFFPDSRPDPADWTQLTIAQAAADQHDVIARLRPVLTGPWVTTGQSKGGMTAIYHRRFYPDDVAGTVAYVAPISFAAGDTRYDAWVNDTIGTPECRARVKALAAELLSHRRAMLLARAQAEADADHLGYTRVKLGPAVESAATELYWAFWQYYGGAWCADLPADPAVATDDALWEIVEGTPDGKGRWRFGVSPVYGNSDRNVALFEAYQYQAAGQLGYPSSSTSYLDGLTIYGEADYAGTAPAGVMLPAYDGGAAMHDVDAWIHGGGAAHLIWVYGGWDPWTAGQFAIDGATDAAKVVVADQNHGALLTELAAPDRATTFAMIQAWTGVTPDPGAVTSNLRALPAPRPALRPPPALVRLMRLRSLR